MVGVQMHLVSAPPADDRRREMLSDASDRFPHLRREQGMAWLGRWETGLRTKQSMLCFAFVCCGNKNMHGSEQRAQGRTTSFLTGLLGHDGAVGVLDDGRQGAVVVEEHDDLLPARRLDHGLELGQCRRVLLLRKHGSGSSGKPRERRETDGTEHGQRTGRGCQGGARAHVRTIQWSCSARRGEVAIVTESSQDPAAVRGGGGGNDAKRRLGCGFTGDAAAAASASSAGNAVCFVICDRAGGRAQKGAEQAGELRQAAIGTAWGWCRLEEKAWGFGRVIYRQPAGRGNSVLWLCSSSMLGPIELLLVASNLVQLSPSLCR
jgi:hypothetical protein